MMYNLNLKEINKNIKYNTIKMGSNRFQDKSVNVNSLYFTFDDKIVLPRMGEFHFSRLNYEYWEESILKLKACGINIISTYIFWIHHEEEEGKFIWSGKRDLRRFLEFCKKYKMNVVLRLGPWAHGEARNGGFPDWLVKAIPKPLLRSNNEYYLEKVEIFFKEIYKQVEGHLFKDGGAVIAVQIENEYKGSREHLMKLKDMAISIGFDTPFYTATAWSSRGYSDIPDGEMVPAFGGYPDAPWANHIEKLERPEQYIFTEVKNDEIIGSDLDTEDKVSGRIDTSLYPYITCEVGTGVQATKHRRPKIKGDDVVSMAYVKVGSGVNLIGYYMFHGGTNPYGRLSRLNESKDTVYPNDLPVMTYDFQAAIGEYGILNESYKGYKMFHQMLEDFGNKIANTKTIIPKEQKELRFSIRADKNSGFIFINNYQRYSDLKAIKDVCFNIELEDGNLQIPSKTMTVPKNEFFVIPYNLDLWGINLKYSTAQPICMLKDSDMPTYFFCLRDGIIGELAFDIDAKVSATLGEVNFKDGMILVSNIEGSLESGIVVEKNSQKVRIIILDKENSLNLWKVKLDDKEQILISENAVISNDKNLVVYTSDNENVIKVFNSNILGNNALEYAGKEGLFKNYKVIIDKIKEIKVSFKSISEYEYEINVPEDILDGVDDVILNIQYKGDSAELYSDNRLIADNFYIDGNWKVSIKHLKEYVEGKKLTLKINPLLEGAYVYLEKWPELINGQVSELEDIKLTVERKVEI